MLINLGLFDKQDKLEHQMYNKRNSCKYTLKKTITKNHILGFAPAKNINLPLFLSLSHSRPCFFTKDIDSDSITRRFDKYLDLERKFRTFGYLFNHYSL
ncbi:hypothetical protein L2E82_24457 [Cichorium intybus]|uniref:Uncharacterized protein n=1 Tax=Cichorium intybus TaxID=13427 RepID=A0ACB9E168_CICIN|nr:hypothetical protein L2E82_24457 [Cichorium intybus]